MTTAKLLQPAPNMAGETAFEWATKRTLPQRNRGGKLVVHTYTDADGEPVFWKYRCKNPDGSKEIRPFRRNENGSFEYGEPPFPNGKPLYRLHEIASAQDPIFIVEGETCADALAAIGIPATTSGACSSAGRADWEPLRGRTVTIWPDLDNAGRAYAAAVSAILRGMGCAVSIVDVSRLGLPEHGDCVDWLAVHPGATAADVLALATVAEIPATTSTATTSSTSAATVGDWPEPQPLPDAQAPVPAFKTFWLPPALKGFVDDVSSVMPCPPEYVAVSLVVALGSLIGRKVGILPRRRDARWIEFPNLWGMIVAPPAAKKSPAMREALSFLSPLIGQADAEFSEAMKAHRVAEAAAKLKVEVAEKAAKKILSDNPDADVRVILGTADMPDPPSHRRYVTDNCTASALMSVLAANPNGFLIKRDELMTLLKQVDRDDAQDLRALLMSGADGKTPVTDDTIKHGARHVDACTLSLIGTSQPDAIGPFIDRVLQSGNGGDGLLARFGLAVWPDPMDVDGIDAAPDERATRRVAEVFRRLADLDVTKIGADMDDDGTATLRFTPAAQEMFDAWNRELEARIRNPDMSSALQGHLGKHAKTVCGLALIYHLAEGRTGPVGDDALHYSIEWQGYLAAHAERLYRAGKMQDVAAAHCVVRHVRRGDLEDGFTLRHLYRRGWGEIKSREAAKAAVDLLLDYGHLRTLPIDLSPAGGRPTERYAIHPSLTAR